MFDENCDLNDTEAQEDAVRACGRANPGKNKICISRTTSKSHLGFCMTLCIWQHERGALFIVILTDSEETFSEEQFVALEAWHQNEGSAWLGRDLRQMETRARLESNLPAMSRARVWTNSFTVTVQIQQDAIAQTRPLHSEELCHLLETVF